MGIAAPGVEHPAPSDGASVGTNDARIKQEVVKEGVKLTRVSLFKKRVRCAHEGCIMLTNGVYCLQHLHRQKKDDTACCTVGGQLGTSLRHEAGEQLALDVG